MANNDVIKRAKDSKETMAFIFLTLFAIPAFLFALLWIILSYGVLLIWVGLGLLIGGFIRRFFAAYIKSNAVRVSEEQLPEIAQIARDFCEKASYSSPDIYVIQHNLWNAFAAKLAGKRIVVLYSGAVDSLLLTGDMKQLAWLVGHELGHHIAGHLDFWVQLVEFFGGWCIWINLWYSRRRELTCDNIGLLCADNLDSTLKAMANMTVGSQLAHKINIDAAEKQWEAHRKELFVRWKTVYSTHPHNLCRITEIRKKARELQVA